MIDQIFREQVEKYIKEKGYTWTYEAIMQQYECYKAGWYISHTAKNVIKNVIEPNDKDRV